MAARGAHNLVPKFPVFTKKLKFTNVPIDAVMKLPNGREVRNRNALANPDALAHFADRPELA